MISSFVISSSSSRCARPGTRCRSPHTVLYLGGVHDDLLGDRRVRHPPTSRERLIAFYRKVHPSGPGWAVRFVNENGGLRYVRATMARHARDESDFITTTAIHAVDALRHVAGEVADFESEVIGNGRGAARWYTISLDFAGGVAGQVEILPTAGVVEETYELFGEGVRAQVVCGSGSQRSLRCWRGGRLEIDETADDVPEDVRNGGYDEVVEFVSALAEGRRPRPTIEDVLPSTRICFSIAEALEL
jgi:predicted dehydrogenase